MDQENNNNHNATERLRREHTLNLTKRGFLAATRESDFDFLRIQVQTIIQQQPTKEQVERTIMLMDPKTFSDILVHGYSGKKAQDSTITWLNTVTGKIKRELLVEPQL